MRNWSAGSLEFLLEHVRGSLGDFVTWCVYKIPYTVVYIKKFIKEEEGAL